MDRLINLASPLLEFCQHIGLSEKFLVHQEEPKWIKHFDPEFQTAKFDQITLPMLTSLIETYGDAFTCEFRFTGDSLKISLNLSEHEFDHFKSIVRHTPTFDFSFELNKNRLAEILQEQLLQPPPVKSFSCNVFLYLFVEAFKKLLSFRLEKLEDILWGTEASCKAVLLIPGHEIYLNGSYLSVLGGRMLQQNLSEVFTHEIPDKNIQSMYERCQELVRWKGIEIKHLTPLHFKVAGESSQDDPISRAIYICQAKMIVFYTADQTLVRSDEKYLAIFSGEKQRKEILLNDLSNLTNEEIRVGSKKLLERVEWIYSSSKVEDSLFLFQLVVVRSLQITEPTECYRLLLLKADDIVNEFRWLWKSFAEGKIDSYIGQVKTLEDYFSGVIQSLSEQISSMIKSLSDTMLAAIGVVLASFIAALFKDSFDPIIFRIGIITYVVYVLIFPLTYNMSYQRRYFNSLCKNFDRRRNRFELILDPSKVSEIVNDQFEECKKRFNGWFNLVRITYGLVATVAFLAAVFVPDFLPQTPSGQPSTPPTSNPGSVTPSVSPSPVNRATPSSKPQTVSPGTSPGGTPAKTP